MPLSALAEKALLGYELGDTAPTIPGTHYAGLLAGSVWAASTAYTVGQFVIAATWSSLPSSSVSKVFKCTTAGTSGSTVPSGFSTATAGSTVTDGSVTWTEASNLLAGWTTAAPVAIEPSGNGYARVAVTNNTTNWPSPSGSDPTTVQNGTAITFPTTTGSWGAVVFGYVLMDASTSGNARLWGLLTATTSALASSGVVPSFAVSAVSVTLL